MTASAGTFGLVDEVYDRNQCLLGTALGCVPTEGTPVSIPGAARKYAYPAYGEDRVPARTAPVAPGLILTKRTTR